MESEWKNIFHLKVHDPKEEGSHGKQVNGQSDPDNQEQGSPSVEVQRILDGVNVRCSSSVDLYLDGWLTDT